MKWVSICRFGMFVEVRAAGKTYNPETAESDIDEGVGGADTAFNPY